MVRAQRAGGNLQQGGFASPIAPQKRKGLATGQLDIEIVNHDLAHTTHVVAHRDMFKTDHRLQRLGTD